MVKTRNHDYENDPKMVMITKEKLDEYKKLEEQIRIMEIDHDRIIKKTKRKHWVNEKRIFVLFIF